MKSLRKYSSILLLIIFGCYYTSINFFSHTHIINGHTIVHSHLGGDTEHAHSESQFTVIDIISQFQSESAPEFYLADGYLYHISDILTEYHELSDVNDVRNMNLLRGPPQC